MEGKKLEVAT